MAVITWFAVDCNLYTHPKLMQLAAALKIDADAAAGKLGRLWAWAKQAGNETGDISWMPESEIADIMRWKKKPDALIASLIQCGFLDRTGSGLRIHGWEELNGKLQSKKRADRERKSDGKSTENPRKIRGISAKNPSGFHGNSTPTRPDHTLPSLSSPSVQKESKAAAPPAPSERFSEPVAETVREWLAYKQERREAYKPVGLKSLLTEIENQVRAHGEQAVCDVIRLSMANNWRGIVWDRIENGGRKPAAQGISGQQLSEWETQWRDRVKQQLEARRGADG